MRKLTAFACLAAIATALSGAPGALAITKGQPDGARHPEVGALVAYFPPAERVIAYCSGTLISPTVFLTAAHCGVLVSSTGEIGVTFDEEYTDTSTVYTGTFYGHPGFKPRTYSQSHQNPDIAVVVFPTPIPGIAPAQLPTAGLLDAMKADGTLNQGTQFTSVGYGDEEFTNGPGGKTTVHLQARYYSVGSFDSLTPAYLHLTQVRDEGGTCNGDSGGPNYLGAGDDETSIIAGLTVTGDIYCHATNVDYRLDTETARDFLDDYVAVP